MKIEDKILKYVVDELISRGIIEEETYNNLFGCKSYEEVEDGIKKILKGE